MRKLLICQALSLFTGCGLVTDFDKYRFGTGHFDAGGLVGAGPDAGELEDASMDAPARDAEADDGALPRAGGGELADAGVGPDAGALADAGHDASMLEPDAGGPPPPPPMCPSYAGVSQVKNAQGVCCWPGNSGTPERFVVIQLQLGITSVALGPFAQTVRMKNTSSSDMFVIFESTSISANMLAPTFQKTIAAGEDDTFDVTPVDACSTHIAPWAEYQVKVTRS